LEKGLYLKLKIWQTKRPDTRFIFGTSSDAVNWHFLRACKATAKRAGLNEADFWLHKFRDTFATWSLRRGANIRDVQGWLGHSKIEMTERYLEKGKGKYAQQKINQAWGSVNFGVAAVGAD
jgi:integrase/recombinase XerD